MMQVQDLSFFIPFDDVLCAVCHGALLANAQKTEVRCANPKCGEKYLLKDPDEISDEEKQHAVMVDLSEDIIEEEGLTEEEIVEELDDTDPLVEIAKQVAARQQAISRPQPRPNLPFASPQKDDLWDTVQEMHGQVMAEMEQVKVFITGKLEEMEKVAERVNAITLSMDARVKALEDKYVKDLSRIFLDGTRECAIIRALVHGPKTLADIKAVLPPNPGKSPTDKTISKWIMVLDRFRDFQILEDNGVFELRARS